MRYIPLTEDDRKYMLGVIGVAGMEDLLKQIPDELRVRELLPIGKGLAEKDLLDHLGDLAGRMPAGLVSFAGAGCYERFIPAAIAPLVTRGEFATAYTPYQPEMAQGTLQASFEFQSLVSMLTGMELANSSMYDGATSTAEAVLMAARVLKHKRRTFVVSGALHPEYLEVVRTYTEPPGLNIVVVPVDAKTGRTDAAALKKAVADAGQDFGGLLLQSPNFFGVIEDWKAAAELAHGAGGKFIAAFTDATSLGILSPPGDFGADIVCGEGQGWGLPMSWGGPGVGIFACKMADVRQLPGRIVGETIDTQGRRGFVLTLATREQHIRREKATSNICTSQQLCALWATMWLSLFGKSGLAELARRNHAAAQYAKKKLGALPGYKIRYSGATYNEFVLDCPKSADAVVTAAGKKKIVPGVALGRFFGKDHEKSLLVCATEMRTSAEIDALAAALGEAGK